MSSDPLVLPALPMPSFPGRKRWLSSVVLATFAGLYLVAGLSVAWLEPGGSASANVSTRLPNMPDMATPPKPEPLQFREVAPQDALAMNAAVPVSAGPNPAARPFKGAFVTEADRLRALQCLTAAVYYEAAIEPTEGQRAVAQVVLNRARHPAYPRSVCGVVYQGSERSTGCQFTFTCDGSLARTPSAAGWARARKVAEEALAGTVYAPVGWATHYHTNWVVPYWSSSLVKAANVGTHIFYRWEGGWGRPTAFGRGPAGIEPQVGSNGQLAADAEALAAGTVDAAAALAAKVAAAANPDTVVAGSVDSFQRAVLRRYEPMTREAATAAAAARSREPLSESTHWALSGVPAAPAPALGRKPAATPAPPRCLEGVRRAPAEPGAAPEKQAC